MTDEQQDTIWFQVNQQGIALLKVNRRHACNALDSDARHRFAACIDKVKSDKNVRSLIITGSGDDAFVSEADLKEILHNHDMADPLGALAAFSEKRPPVFNRPE